MMLSGRTIVLNKPRDTSTIKDQETKAQSKTKRHKHNQKPRDKHNQKPRDTSTIRNQETQAQSTFQVPTAAYPTALNFVKHVFTVRFVAPSVQKTDQLCVDLSACTKSTSGNQVCMDAHWLSG